MSAGGSWPPSGFDELSPEEKVDYVQSLWDRITASEDRVAVPDWHKEIIRQRLAGADANPIDWAAIRDRMTHHLRQSKAKA